MKVQSEMKLSVGFNWDPLLLEGLAKYPVHDVFGAMPNTPMGGGRPGFMLPEIEENKTLKDYVEQAHSLGIKFTYLFNAPCLNNMEFDERVHNEFLAFVEMLNNANVDYLTISIPYLIELVREQFPAFKIKSSVIQQINSIRRAQLFEELGASIMNPDYMINRDFNLLRNMKKALNGELMLLVNDLCMYQCPFRYYHYNMIGHASQSTTPLGNFYIDYCATRCTLLKFGNPGELLRARWIRPEDIKEYEALGIEYFKISGRNLSTEWLLRAVKAYTDKKYDGNLMDILMRASVGLNMDYHAPHFEKLLTDEVLADDRLKSFVNMADVPFITAFIDNSKLDGFLEPFKTIDCINTNCRDCRHCDDWAKKAIKRDPELTKQYLQALNQVYKDLTTSKYFRARDGSIIRAESGKKKKKKKDRSKKKSDDGIKWAKDAEELLDKAMGDISRLYRRVARMVSKRGAQSNARKRNSRIVERDDLIRAFLTDVPKPFRKTMFAGLEGEGIDIKKYQEELGIFD